MKAESEDYFLAANVVLSLLEVSAPSLLITSCHTLSYYIYITKWGWGGRRKNSVGSDSRSPHHLVRFFRAQNALCHRAEREPEEEGDRELGLK